MRDTPPDARPAAALILLYPTEHGYSIPLTVRHSDLPHHPGQISLPGGRIDQNETAEAAALREAHEEIGVDPREVCVLGSLTPLYVLVSRFVITPFVGVAAARPHFVPAEREVEELIEVPVDHLRDRRNISWGHRTREGYLIDFPYFHVASHHVWGATAMMLGEFVSLLEEGFAPAERGA
jgi:8-oxo-dGTP pyrophosphatase MutT (NUDIX family)